MVFLHKCNASAHNLIEFGVKGVSGGLNLCHFPDRKVAWV